ncbi:MAG: thiamine kinase [Gammaproteobacteria bacterium]|jgi:thiamine kinase
MHKRLNSDELDLPFRGPIEEIRDLSQGRTNKSTLIRAEGSQWVLRIGSPKAQQLGINRAREEIVWRCAADAGVAPAVAYCSLEREILITEFIDGVHWQPNALRDDGNLEKLIDFVEQVHKLKIPIAVTDYYEHAENYWLQLEAANYRVPDSIKTMRDHVLRRRTVSAGIKLCHRDITPANVIDYRGRLYLLDWEYAARGDPAFDYAAIANEWDVSTSRLLSGSGTTKADFAVADLLYRYTCALWELLNDSFN